MRVLQFSPLREFILEFLKQLNIPFWKSWGYNLLMSSSSSHVASFSPWWFQMTFIEGISFERSFRTCRSTTTMSSSTYDIWKSTSTACGYNTWDSSERYFRSIDMWNTRCTLESSRGRATSYATAPCRRSISNGPIYFGLNFHSVMSKLWSLPDGFWSI